MELTSSIASSVPANNLQLTQCKDTAQTQSLRTAI